MRRKDRQITLISELKSILDDCKTCHVAMLDGQNPYVVPLSYAYSLENAVLTMYFHSAKEGRKIDILRNNNNVCFEISSEGRPLFTQTPCNSGYYYSSIIGFGKVFFIDDINEKCAALSLLFEHQSGRRVDFCAEQAKSVSVFKIVSTDFTGKRKKESV